MKMRIYFLAIVCALVLLAASLGEAAMLTPPAEGEQGSAPAITTAQGQGSSPTGGENADTSPQATSPEGSPPATTSQPARASTSGEQNASGPAPEQKEAAPAAAPPSSSPVAEEQNAPAATQGQEEAVPAATNLEGSPASTTSQQGSASTAGEQNAATSAPEQKEAVPAAVTPPSPAPATPAAGEQKAPAPAAGQQATTLEAAPLAKEPPPAAAGAQEGTPAAAESPGAYPAMGAQQPASTPAGGAGGGGLSLKESIAIALQKSPTVQSAQSAIQGAEYQRRAAISDFLPLVSMGYNYTRYDQRPFAILGGTKQDTSTKNNYLWSTSVSQPVFTGGALINSYLLAKIGVDSAKVTLEQTKLDLVLQVKVAYYAVLTAEKAVEIGQQSVADFESHYTVAKAFFEVGITAKNDVLQVEVQLAQARQNLIAAEHNLEVARAVFNTLLRRDINEPVGLGETLEYNPLTMNMNALYNEALRQRPEIRLSDLGIESAKKEVGIAASKLFPQVSIVYTYERRGDDPSIDGSDFARMHDWNVMGVAQWNVWDWGKAWWGVEQSKANVFQAQCALEQVKDAVKLDVQAAALRVTEASKNLQVAETAVGQAEEDARINEEKFKGQVATTTDVLDSLTRLTQARINYYSALSDYNIARARLQRSIGSQ